MDCLHQKASNQRDKADPTPPQSSPTSQPTSHAVTVQQVIPNSFKVHQWVKGNHHFAQISPVTWRKEPSLAWSVHCPSEKLHHLPMSHIHNRHGHLGSKFAAAKVLTRAHLALQWKRKHCWNKACLNENKCLTVCAENVTCCVALHALCTKEKYSLIKWDLWQLSWRRHGLNHSD